ncbi:EpsG family protein [Citrobacter freundii]|nr:EpsG family protein [Citrobacter freundii]
MFVIVQCLPFLFFALLWFVFGKTAKNTILTLSVLILSLAYTSFYLNGEDWVNYYVNFYTHNGSSWFEPGFLLFYSLLRFVAFESFGIATLLFYTTAFSCLILAANKNKKCNVPAFLFFVLFFFGNTLILEQLRQFISVIIVFCALQSKMQGKGLKAYIYVVISITFHASAVIVLLSFVLADVKSKKIFILSTLLLSVGLTFTFVNDSVISLGVQLIPTIFTKIQVYNEFTNVNFYIGPSMLLALTLLGYYLLSTYKLSYSHATESTFLQRQIFFGGAIFFIGAYIPFMSRLTSYYIIFLFYDIACNHAPRYFKLYKKDGFLLIFVFLFISSNLFSYYKNDIAPVKFEQLTFNFFPFVSGEIDYKKRISDIFYKNAEVLSGSGVEKEK